MPLAVLYDIHGNLPALEAVLDEARLAGADEIVVGGDVFPGPMANQCLDLLRATSLPVCFIRGNGDREVLAARAGAMSPEIPEQFRPAIQWNADQLRAQDVEIIRSWPLTLQRSVERVGDVLFCHATPRNDTEIFTTATAEAKLLPIFDTLDVDLVVCGHTHIQFDRVIGRTRVVNAGSVGMPFQDPAAYWLLLDGRVDLRATKYDLPAAASRVRQTAYPQAEHFAANNILSAPNATAMIEALSKAELT
ncbi:MAG TPA: metallophosphoesterase family protein [Vicinamibacterales bacterium]|nr:metallophosphoesterase family protein [Vicinamibacterales bacterium]